MKRKSTNAPNSNEPLSPAAKKSQLNRRAFIAAAGTGIVGLTYGGAFAQAQNPLDAIMDHRERGVWKNQFDARGQTVQAVATNTPVFSQETLQLTQAEIYRHEQIVANGGWGRVPATRATSIGSSDPAIEKLRRRLMFSGDLSTDAGMSQSFDSYVQGALKRFQSRHGLPADGVLGTVTLKALNVGADTRLDQLRINLQRLQPMAYDPGRRFVMVNIPAAEIEAVENGRVALRHTAIVGKIDRQTPIVSSKIFELNLNPYWNAPASIVEKDIIPLMRKDPSYLENARIKVLRADGSEIPASQINWQTNEAVNYHFRQEPGKRNAMASVKINFPNEHAVYLHDTPQKSLFNKLLRFDSSGCVRVQNVRDLITWLAKETPGWQRRQIEGVIEEQTRTDVKLFEPVPIYLTYVSAWSAAEGVAQFRDDIYRKDGAAELALGNG